MFLNERWEGRKKETCTEGTCTCIVWSIYRRYMYMCMYNYTHFKAVQTLVHVHVQCTCVCTAIYTCTCTYVYTEQYRFYRSALHCVISHWEGCEWNELFTALPSVSLLWHWPFTQHSTGTCSLHMYKYRTVKIKLGNTFRADSAFENKTLQSDRAWTHGHHLSYMWLHAT